MLVNKMPTIAIINIQTSAIETFYEDEQPNQQKYGGPWGWDTHTVHIALPEGLHKNIVKVVRGEDGTFTFQIDEEKQNAEINQKWSYVRQLRNEKLKDCDWTQCNDVPFTSEQIQAWKLYRQALRDLPNLLTEDQIMNPSTISWTTPPN